MHATIRRYEASTRITGKTDQEGRREPSAAPERDAGLQGYHLIEADNGVMSCIDFFDTSVEPTSRPRRSHLGARGEAGGGTSNPPKVTGGDVIVEKTNGLVRA